MDLGLAGKNALVTGASYGLGYSCAKALALEGANVAICSRDSDQIKSAADEISQLWDTKVFGISADLTSENDLLHFVDAAKAALKKIDILVVSTGHPPTYPFSAATDADWKLGTDLVLKPPILLTRLLLDEMRSNRYGRIIFIGSIFGLEPEQTSVVQSTLRTGLNALAKCIATEVAGDGVTLTSSPP